MTTDIDICPYCEREIVLRVDGKFHVHHYPREADVPRGGRMDYCAGSGRDPKAWRAAHPGVLTRSKRTADGW